MTSRRPAKTNNESNQSATPLEVSQSNPSPSTASPAPPCEPENHISHGISTIKRAAHPAMSRWLSLSSTQRYAAAAILFPFIVFPTIWLLFLSPGIAFFFVVTYSVLFGFWTFIAHFEAALQEHFALSPESLKKVHANADKLRSQAKLASNKELPACVQLERDNDGQVIKRKYDEQQEHYKEAIYPIDKGQLVNIEELEHLLRHVILHKLQLTEPISDLTVLLVIPGNWSRDTRLSLLRVMFEKIGVAGVYFGEAPVVAAFGCATPTALVVDVGHTVTEVAAVLDGEIISGAYEMIPLGGRDIDNYISNIIDGDKYFQESIKGREDIFASERIEIARSLKESEIFHPVKGGFGGENNGIAPASFKYKSGLEFMVGECRMNAADILFHPISPCGLIEAIMGVLARCDSDKRPLLLDHLIITGSATRLPLIRSRIEKDLRARLVISEFSGEYQVRNLRVRTVPEYYPELWQRATPLAAWFGAGITAKCVLGDSRNYYTRDDLSQHGPRIFLNKQI